MKSKTCKSKTVKITKELTESYQLIAEDGKYSIICIEKNSLTGETSVEKASQITESLKKASSLFNLLVKNKACEGTINDIIRDQMC